MEKLLVDGLYNKLDPHYMPMAKSIIKVIIFLTYPIIHNSQHTNDPTVANLQALAKIDENVANYFYDTEFEKLTCLRLHKWK